MPPKLPTDCQPESLVDRTPRKKVGASSCSSSGPAMKTCLITRSYLVALWALLFVSCGPTVAQSVAVFDFELIDTSLEGAIRGARLDEQERLARLSDQLRQLLRASGRFSLIAPP